MSCSGMLCSGIRRVVEYCVVKYYVGVFGGIAGAYWEIVGEIVVGIKIFSKNVCCSFGLLQTLPYLCNRYQAP